MAKHEKPTSRLTDVFTSSQELAAEEVVFLPKEKRPAAPQPEAPVQGEAVAAPVVAKPQKSKPTAKGKRGPGRPRAAAVAAAAAPRARRGKGGRLRRRSATDIAGVVPKVVALLHANPKGLRAEQIRAKLGLDSREMPRPLAEALRKKLVSKKGRKRATTYFAGKGKK